MSGECPKTANGRVFSIYFSLIIQRCFFCALTESFISHKRVKRLALPQVSEKRRLRGVKWLGMGAEELHNGAPLPVWNTPRGI
jgi:hypothetical protein